MPDDDDEVNSVDVRAAKLHQTFLTLDTCIKCPHMIYVALKQNAQKYPGFTEMWLLDRCGHETMAQTE